MAISFRAYNRKTDNYYSPDDTPHLFLTEEQVNNALGSLPIMKEPEEIKVREIIKQIETINRDEKMGNISSSEANKKISTISDDFLFDFGFWPYITKSFELFYKSFEQ
jgi:hypothetical protein